MHKKARSSKSRQRPKKPKQRMNSDAAVEAFVKGAVAIEADRRERRERYLRAIEPSRFLGPIDRARAWLRYFAENCGQYGEEEAIVYCKSRQIDCRYDLDSLLLRWSDDANAEIERARTLTDTLADAQLKEFRIDGTDSSWALNDFWTPSRVQQTTLEATMLRTVEWCDIREFDQWWLRAGRATEESALTSGIDTLFGGRWLFDTCRSRLAMNLMPSACERTLKLLESVHGGSRPHWYVRHHLTDREAIHLGHIACLLFAHARLRHKCSASALIEEAVSTLLANQRPDGSWAVYDVGTSPSVHATAMAMTALRLVSPGAAEGAIQRARDWLLASQLIEGYWRDPAVDPFYLTVLVMDALEAQGDDPGGHVVTFDPPEHRLASAQEPRFRVALSFPGEHRQFMDELAQELARRLGMQRVFYDRFYEAELARVNLDTYLQRIYLETPLVVVLLCEEYQGKEWCGLEFRAIRELIKTRQDERVMLLRHGAPNVDGIFSIDGYVQVEGRKSAEIAELVIRRLIG
jgi:hypothetical protein